MRKNYIFKTVYSIFFFICGVSSLHAQISFNKGDLEFNGHGDVSSGVTSLMYGPDGRLYVAEYPGTIKILTISRVAAANYQVTDVEVLSGVTDIVNHDDDGSVNAGVTQRETTGLTVVGTASNPVIYVTSSDFRIGAGSGGGSGDIDLDTNSGIITRFSWNGSSWDVVDLVRGLTRSEENHATNGLEFVEVNGIEYLIVTSGGHTNAGSPSKNFVFTCEYALSGAVLSVNMDMLNAMPVKTDGDGRKYIYDLPTVDDPTRPNVNGITDPDHPNYNGIDVNDPFGGNDGLNQAIVVPGGPVQIFSPGYRNTYDLVVTESGAVYVTDNGANKGWGGLPDNEGGAGVTNDYDPAELGSSTATVDGELVNNEDHLQLVTTDIASYSFGSYYGGHPNPIRANPNGAGLFTAPNTLGTTGAVFRTLTYDPDGSRPGSTNDPNMALPANWPPVNSANVVEGDWRGPGMANPDGPTDGAITLWGTNTNGIDEYTASNFGGAMKGDLIAGHNGGILRRVELKADGTLEKLTTKFLTGVGGNALGVTCNGDLDEFPGTIWIGALQGKIVVYEPDDFVNCVSPGAPSYNPNADYDSDGYTNQDEELNGSDPCNAGSQPSDFDKIVGGTLTSDLTDTDDDNDGILDQNDPFQLGNPQESGSDAFVIPVNNNFYSTQGLGGLFGIGFTGVMNNGDPNPNWKEWLDVTGQGPNPDDVIDWDAGLMTLHMPEGSAQGNANDQIKGYQFGVKTDKDMGKIVVSSKLLDFSGPLRLYDATSGVTDGELGIYIGDGTQSNFIKFVITQNGLVAQQEVADVPEPVLGIDLTVPERPSTDIILEMLIDLETGEVTFEYIIDGGTKIELGKMTALGEILNAMQSTSKDLAVGVIGTSNTAAKELEGTWDYLKVKPAGDLVTYRINTGGPQLNHEGKSFSEDQYAQNGYTYSNSNALVADLYKTERTASNTLNFAIPLPAGDFKVTLHFAEIFWGATGGSTGGMGSRIFDVSMEGALILDNLDIFAEVGAETPYVRTFDATVEDGFLNLNFSSLASNGGVNQPKISAIEIVEIPRNEPPVAVASADPLSGIVPLEVSFVGVNSTDDEEIASYLWDFNDGTPNSTDASPVHTFTAVGTYDVTLTVTDNKGLVNSTSLQIIVDPVPNQAPNAVVTALPTSGYAPLEVFFKGSSSSDDNAVVAYNWDFKDNGVSSTDPDPAHTFENPGTYEVALQVSDAEGLTDTKTITIVVEEVPVYPPVAIGSASPISGTAPLKVDFTGDGSTDDKDGLVYEWDFKDGSAITNQANPSHTFTLPGTYNVQLTVTDSDDLSDTVQITVVVLPRANNGPTAIISASPNSGTAPLEVTFSGQDSADDQGIVSYSWDFNDGSPMANTVSVDHIFANDGLYDVSLTVADQQGLTSTSTVSIVVFKSSEGKQLEAKLLVNPATDVAQIQLLDTEDQVNKVQHIYVHDSSGKLVAQFNPKDIVAHGLYNIPVHMLASGNLYVLRFEMEDGRKFNMRLLVN